MYTVGFVFMQNFRSHFFCIWRYSVLHVPESVLVSVSLLFCPLISKHGDNHQAPVSQGVCPCVSVRQAMSAKLTQPIPHLEAFAFDTACLSFGPSLSSDEKFAACTFCRNSCTRGRHDCRSVSTEQSGFWHVLEVVAALLGPVLFLLW